jgi:hypothetical protein
VMKRMPDPLAVAQVPQAKGKAHGRPVSQEVERQFADHVASSVIGQHDIDTHDSVRPKLKTSDGPAADNVVLSQAVIVHSAVLAAETLAAAPEKSCIRPVRDEPPKVAARDRNDTEKPSAAKPRNRTIESSARQAGDRFARDELESGDRVRPRSPGAVEPHAVALQSADVPAVAPDASPHIAVVSGETHLDPVTQFAPLAVLPTGLSSPQVPSHVSAKPAVPRPELPAPPMSARPLKILKVQVTSPEHGLVTATMRLKNAGLELRLDAASADTAIHLEENVDKLSDLLQVAGYAVDEVSVRRIADSENRQAVSANADGFPAAPGSTANHSDQNGGQQQSSPADQCGTSKEAGGDDANARLGNSRGNGDIYL